ncbi:MAG: hypothetical protein ACOH2V_14060 [Candidatus Saccharimonadaceae bacterium]
MENGIVECYSAIPFHGIISRGLLRKFIEYNLDALVWQQYAHQLFDSNPISDISELEEIKKHSLKCMVLSFAQSSFCVKKYVEHLLEVGNIDDAQIELWNIKEGHTSSVWKVSIILQKTTEVFIVNVARDHDAGIELKESSEMLKKISDQFPDINLAKVYDIYTLNETSLPSEVVITRNEWIPDSFEIHKRVNKQTEEEELLMVERFVTNQNNPSQITSVLGKVFGPSDALKIKNEITDFLNKATTCLTAKPEININDGDVVWNGKRAVIVALN